jgi:hypothetical protein
MKLNRRKSRNRYRFRPVLDTERILLLQLRTYEHVKTWMRNTSHEDRADAEALIAGLGAEAVHGRAFWSNEAVPASLPGTILRLPCITLYFLLYKYLKDVGNIGSGRAQRVYIESSHMRSNAQQISCTTS